ncbi:FAD binding domain-containing protein [Aquibacillus rhizosphaerae]|uniref:FAD binding domain-containing protein n=1 Tax=Aquibacillus rhizosphaerae TaxID=3051431 RepID=A0ABT7L711_9BACI|nr:FAD binding domain-containing protein [Aquibacillus sp. LR5S19]MDL4841010.1 FAD binding domain-containing protein [Aquibacillus sp. LR5S19]
MVKGNKGFMTEENIVTTSVSVPTTIEDAFKQKQTLGKAACYIAGGTLIQLKREQGTPLPQHLISLEQIAWMSDIKRLEDSQGYSLMIGVLASLSICQSHPTIREEWPLLSEAIQEVASPAVRNRGTIGGNIIYRIGDTIPALLTLEAKITWFDGDYRSEILWNFLQKNMLEDVIITSLSLPSPPIASRTMNFYRKVGRREGFIPSLVTVSAYCCWNSDEQVDYVRLAVGGGANTPKRLERCEQFIIGKKISIEILEELYQKVIEEFFPEPDKFVSTEYQQTVAANLIVSELESFLDESIT